nr:transposase [Psychrobacter pacificensis]
MNTVYPNAQVQLCIVHMLRYSMKFVPWTDKKAVAADLKAIYGADTLEIAEANLEHFDETCAQSTRMSSSLGAIIGRA